MSRTAIALDPVHDGRHKLRRDALARESLVWMLQLPEEQVAGFVYTWVSGEGRAGTALALWGPAVGEQPIFEIIDGIAVPDEQGFDDWRVSSLHVRQGEPLVEAAVSFAGERANLDYRFTAMHPAYAYGSHPRGCPSFLADDRFEQSGTVEGHLWLGGREIEFSTTGHRDHSWGTRDWGVAQHWKWLEAQAGPEVAVHAIEVYALGRRELRGYVYRDGELSQITEFDVHDFELDERMHHTALRATLHDELGRATEFAGRTFAMFEFPVSPLATLHEGSMSVEIDGTPGVGHVEMCWPKAYVDYLVRERA
jgi:hypothetical protein